MGSLSLGVLLFQTWHPSTALLLARVAIGLCFVTHGLGKLGLVGTGNMQGFVEFLTGPHATAIFKAKGMEPAAS